MSMLKWRWHKRKTEETKYEWNVKNISQFLSMILRTILRDGDGFRRRENEKKMLRINQRKVRKSTGNYYDDTKQQQ